MTNQSFTQNSTVFSSASRNALKRKLRAATVAGMVMGVAFTGAIASAQVTETSPGEFTATGENTAPQTALANNADVVTEEGFSVVTSEGTALDIVGDGALRYTDENASELSGNIGLQITNTGDDEEIPGSISVNTAGNISGSTYGVNIVHSGTGAVDLTTSGHVSSSEGAGIRVDISQVETPGDITINANSVSAAGNAIHVTAEGLLSNVDVTTTGAIIAGEEAAVGILAITGGDVRVEAQDDITAATGISVSSSLTGNVEIISQGTVTSTTGEGISVYSNSTEAANVTVTANNIHAAHFGIRVLLHGESEAEVNVNGTVEGGIGSILLTDEGDSTVNIAQSAVVRNTSMLSDARSIVLDAGAAVINNSGTIIGYIEGETSTGDVTLNNNGLWHTSNTSNNFGEGNNTINNNAGGVLKAASDNVTSYTYLSQINTFVNSGDIDLRNVFDEVEEEEEENENDNNFSIFALAPSNHPAGDRLYISNTGENIGEFVSNGGRLFVDVDFENQVSDVLSVDNVTLGDAPTRVYVTPYSPGAETYGDGILVVDVAGTSDDAFVLGKPVGRGLYSYELGRGQSDETSQDWFLRSNGEMRDEVPMVSALTVLAGRTSQATLSSPHDRQREGDDAVDYFTRRNGTRLVSRNFTLPADEQVARKGVWGRVFGQNNEFSANGGTRAGYDASTWGAQAGIDLVASGSLSAGRSYGGVYLGYADASGDALRGGTRLGKLKVNATSIGAYYTRYNSNGFYWDATAQYSRISDAELRYYGDRAKSDGSSYLVSLEAGKQLNQESKYVAEVQGQLLYQKTSIDEMRLSDSTRFDVGNLSGVTGRVGVRLARNPHQGAAVQPWLSANLWKTFNQDVRVSSLGESATTPAGGTTGEVQLGLSLVPQKSGSWSAYVAGGYQFDVSGSKYSGWKGTVGVRKGW